MANHNRRTRAWRERPARPSPADTPLRVLAGVALIILATSLAYLPCVHGGFILDDHLLLTDNQLIKAPDGLYRLWFTSEPIDYWPVTNTSLWLEWRLWGMQPTGYHVTNVALHIVAALLLWMTLRALSIPGAFVAALLFALHPVNVESVAWITQRKNLLAMVFLLLSVFWYLKAEMPSPAQRPAPTLPHPPQSGSKLPHSKTRRWYWLSLAAFVLAMLSKGSVAILPLLLLGITWWRRPLTRWDAARTAPFFLVSVALVLVNVRFQARFTHAIVQTDVIGRLLGAGAVVWFYLYKALLPAHLSLVYPKWRIDAGQLRWWLPLLAAASTTCVLWWYRRGWGRPLLLAWGVFCMSLAPVMGFTDVGFMEHSLVADHYQHVALIGVIAVVAAGWGTWQQRAHGSARWVPMALAVAVGSALALLTWKQSGLYADGETLYRATLEQNPDSPFVHNNLGLVLLDAGRAQEAMPHFERALQLRPDYAEVHYNLARTLLQAGQVDEAIGHFQQAAQLKPYADYDYDLAMALVKAHRLPEAIEHFQQALRLNPDSPEAESNLGGVLSEAGRPQEAIEHFERALRLKPAFPAAHSNLGRALLQVGRLEEAIEHLRQAARLDPDSPDAHNDLGVALTNAGQLDAAIEHFQRSLQLRPDDPSTGMNLQEALTMQRKAQ